jgi:5'-3' exonuclease
MGIKHFFRWFKNSFSENIQKMRKGDTFADEEIEIEVDNFFIDMNGLFHGSAQRAYEYGAHAPLPRLLGKRRQNRRGGLQRQLKCFKDVCDTVEMLVKIVNPRKRVILCVDGPAPLSKQNQQRQRRFRSAMERDEKTQSFDSNCITPGTKWMDFLSKYIDWWIRKKMSEDSAWRNLEVVFSNEKSRA